MPSRLILEYLAIGIMIVFALLVMAGVNDVIPSQHGPTDPTARRPIHGSGRLPRM